MPLVCHTSTSIERHHFVEVLKCIKVSDGYESNMSWYIIGKDHKLSGLKSHDWHVLMQQLLPIIVRGLLPDKVMSVAVDIYCQRFMQNRRIMNSLEEHHINLRM